MEGRILQKPSRDRRIIGLTGGIGMGKTTVANYLAAAYHLPILDADLYARQAVEPGSEIFNEILERYGLGIRQSNGLLDRRRLGQIIFSNAAERWWLEQRIHPYVRDRFVQALATLEPGLAFQTIVLVVPLLFEARMTDLVSEIWVVYCSHEKQIERLIQRDYDFSEGDDRLRLAEIQARIDSQMSIDKKIAGANVVIDNSSTEEALQQQIDQIMVQQFPANELTTHSSRTE